MIALLTLVLTAQLAHADAVGPDPTDCPPGTDPTASHAGEWCDATTCQSDADCGDARVCRDQPLCVRTEQYYPGGLRGPDEPVTKLTRHVGIQTCDSPCPTNSRCERARRCVTPSLTEMFTPGAGPSGVSSGCGCGTTGPVAAPIYALAVAAALLFFAARRPR